jgi:hypothetical protein
MAELLEDLSRGLGWRCGTELKSRVRSIGATEDGVVFKGGVGGEATKEGGGGGIRRERRGHQIDLLLDRSEDLSRGQRGWQRGRAGAVRWEGVQDAKQEDEKGLVRSQSLVVEEVSSVVHKRLIGELAGSVDELVRSLH